MTDLATAQRPGDHLARPTTHHQQGDTVADKPYTDADVELVAGWFRRWLGGSASNIRKRDREHATEILDALAAAGWRRIENPGDTRVELMP